MIQGQYTLCVHFIDFFQKAGYLCALALFSKAEPAYNSNILNSGATHSSGNINSALLECVYLCHIDQKQPLGI